MAKVRQIKVMTDEERLKMRRDLLRKLLELNSPDIIIHHQMVLVHNSQKIVHGKGWYRPRGWLLRYIESVIRYDIPNLLKGKF